MIVGILVKVDRKDHLVKMDTMEFLDKEADQEKMVFLEHLDHADLMEKMGPMVKI